MVGIDAVDLAEIRIRDASEFDPDDKTSVLTIDVDAELLLDLLFDKGDAYWLIEEKAGVSFHDMDYNETYAAGQTQIFVRCELQGLFDGEQIEQLELIGMEDLLPDGPGHPAFSSG